MDQKTAINCPLCLSADHVHFHQDSQRRYRRCRACQLVFVPPEQHLSIAEEKAIYDYHQNYADDPGYRQFLSRLSVPLIHKLNKNDQGLDFGCGADSALSAMFTEQGFTMQQYDPLYAPFPEHLNHCYQFICCTEVVEHLRAPHLEFERLFNLLKPGGKLGLMTKMVIDAEAFSRWHYKNDLTHIAFFSGETFHWLAEKYACHLEFFHTDVIILEKQEL